MIKAEELAEEPTPEPDALEEPELSVEETISTF
jgi:hypothetical protein